MANERKPVKIDPEAARRKKEEAARRSRRRMRQLLGVVLSILIVVGVISIVRSGIGLVRLFTDDTAEKAEYRDRIEYMVWFDVLPFSDPEQINQATLKQVAIYGVYYALEDELQTGDTGETLIPALEMDRYVQNLLGPDYRFDAHESFSEPTTGLYYEYDEALQAYYMPGTSMVDLYRPSVVNIARESGGGRRVTVGYISVYGPNGELVRELDYDSPAKYMDFVFRRDGNEYYLTALERSQRFEVTAPAEPPSASNTVPLIPGDVEESSVPDDIVSAPADSSLPEGEEGSGADSADGEDDSSDPMEEEPAPEDE